MKGVFFIVGPTAVGKSALAAVVASDLGGEIVNCDAFQLYRGLEILSAKPDAAILAKVRHHLIGAVALSEEMNAGKFCRLALPLIDDIRARHKPSFVVGGSGLYAKALTHGLETDWDSVDIRPEGVLLLRDRSELYARINTRVEKMFDDGVLDEVRAAEQTSSTSAKMIGLRQIREYLSGSLPLPECVKNIQAATRQYAKRQLTWFRHQTKFEPLNLSLLNQGEAVKRVSQHARRVLAEQG
jgi:tRNA A37 N6-isopentenylltransferase MiaA